MWALVVAGTALAASPRVLLLDAATSGNAVVAVGERGSILRSTDSGASWTSIQSPVTATLTGVAFAPDLPVGWAVGHDAVILGTRDAGLTWVCQWQGSDLENSFLDVCAIDSQRAIAVGAYGLCLATEDGGGTWTARKLIDEDMHLNRITRGPTGTLYVAGEHGTLLRSSDQGHSWLRIDSPYDGSFYGILPLGPRTLLAYGLRGRVYRSTNDGDDWQPVTLAQPALISTALRLKGGSVCLAGQARAFYLSRDDGATFSATSIKLVDAISELVEAADGTVLAFGEAGIARLPSP